MVKFQEKCKKMAYENLEVIRRQEYVKDALEEKKFYKEMSKQEFAQKLLDKQEREKKVEMKKSLTDAWDGQVEYKRQKKMEMDKIKKQGSYSLMESEQLHRTEEVQKKQKKQKLSTQDKTEQNMRDQKKTVDDNLEDILRKEAAYDSLSQKSYATIWPRRRLPKCYVKHIIRRRKLQSKSLWLMNWLPDININRNRRGKWTGLKGKGCFPDIELRKLERGDRRRIPSRN
ncbi:PREDICTED: protein PRRC2C-like [Poecilia mexicana]|uniref:protein PRRC2C-like n=1 Tax=Poecilia mexicana TaxID=48701 RepID=UPI00072EDF47|nr:PREDICTED: protein PRRC2C-like [Poecilia mexicana]